MGGTTTTYIRNYFEWTGSTSTMKKYYYASSQRVAMRTGSAAPVWLFSDHLSSTSKVASSTGTVSYTSLYKAWGETRYTSGTTPTTYRYTGQREEASFGLYYYNARWYDPQLGRFAQADSIVPEGVQAWDRYAYVNNNPVKYKDPSGHDAGCAGMDCGDYGKTNSYKVKYAPPIVDLRNKTQTPTSYPTSTPLPTQTPIHRYEPAATPIPNNSTSSSQSSSIPLPRIYVDPNQVDYLNVVADVSGMVADGLTIASFKIPILAPAAETAQEINAPIEAIGLAKSAIDLTKDMPSGFTPFLTKALQNTLVIGARSERLIPVVGLIGNAVSLYFDLKPQIIWD